MKTFEILFAIFVGAAFFAVFLYVIFLTVAVTTRNRQVEKKLEEERKAQDAAHLQSLKEEAEKGIVGMTVC